MVFLAIFFVISFGKSFQSCWERLRIFRKIFTPDKLRTHFWLGSAATVQNVKNFIRCSELFDLPRNSKISKPKNFPNIKWA